MKESPWQWGIVGALVGALAVASIPKHRPSPDQYEDALNAYLHAQMDLDAALGHASAASDSAGVRSAVADARKAMKAAKASAKRADLAVVRMFEETGRYDSDDQPRPWEGGRY